MKNILLLLLTFSVLTFSCSSKKQIETAISYGNYDKAISNALSKLKNNKGKKRKEDYIKMLHVAFHKATIENKNDIDLLIKDGNPEHYKTIYETYIGLRNRQDRVSRVLPLYLGGKEVSFKLQNYDSEIVDFKYKTSDYLINKGINLLDSNNKLAAREAFRIFEYIEDINPNFEETRNLIAEAKQKGTDNVFVSITNNTQQVIPVALEDDLLNFSTYGLNSFWTNFSTNNEITYDFEVELQLRQINISPERLNEVELLRKKEVKDGWEYLLDENQNVAKDSLGNDIKIDKYITAKARFYEVTQIKESQIIANVFLKKFNQSDYLDSFNIDSGFIFENRFGWFRGDRRALNKDDRRLLRAEEIPFPNDLQMIFDTGEDLKQKFKAILNNLSFN